MEHERTEFDWGDELGIFINGIVVSCKAKIFRNIRTNTDWVLVITEYVANNQLCKLLNYHDPKDGLVEIEDNEVKKFPCSTVGNTSCYKIQPHDRFEIIQLA